MKHLEDRGMRRLDDATQQTAFDGAAVAARNQSGAPGNPMGQFAYW